MSRKFFILIASLLAVAAGLAAHAATQGRGRYGRHDDDGWMLRRMTRELNLTEAQQTQIKSIWEAERAKIQPLRRQLRQNQQAENANVAGALTKPRPAPSPASRPRS